MPDLSIFLSLRRPSLDREGLDRLAGRAAFICCVILPVALLHARAVADILIVAVDLCFLAHAVLDRETAWLRLPFVWAALAWWAWVVLCSAIGTGGLGFALASIRLPLLAVAAGWALREPGRAKAVWWALAASAGWIALQSWEQLLTGTNAFGHGRYVDGALTGPFAKPKAGPALILIFFPVVLPAAFLLLRDERMARRAGGVALAAFAVATMVLIGQRMPTALLGLGLALSALLLPSLRVLALASAAGAAALLAATPLVSPGTYAKLVLQTHDQLLHFTTSAYGLIFVRAGVIAQRYPVHGLGFDGFRRGCSDFWNMHGIEALGIPTAQLNGGQSACNIHPHNYFLEAADNAGVPGVVLFTAMAALLLVPLARGVWRGRDPLRAGILIGAILAFWPLATTSAFTSLPNAGWIFLAAGLGLALSPRGTKNQPG